MAILSRRDPAHAGKALHWDLTDGLGVQWTNAPGAGHGKAIRMDTSQTEKAMVASYTKAGLTQWVFPKPADNTIAETYGLSLYSEAMPVVAGKTYRVTFDYLAEKGTAGKLWFRAYANVNGEKKRVYEGTIDCGPDRAGGSSSAAFFTRRNTGPMWMNSRSCSSRFYPPGVAWFDNIRVEAVDEPETN